MPREKDLKRLVRTRMKKTGEAYTTARAQIVKRRKPASPSPAKSAQPAMAPDSRPLAELAGTSDATIKEKTGCTWDRWVYVLDKRGAADMSHREVAALISDTYKVDGWWAQMVTVGYERIKGKRMKGQRLDGTHEASKSRTFDVPVEKLFRAWENAKVRRKWLDGAPVTVRTATAPKSMRLGWPDGGIVAVWFTAKGDSKSNVAVAHTKLPDKETADRMKQFWGERLGALGEVLAEK